MLLLTATVAAVVLAPCCWAGSVEELGFTMGLDEYGCKGAPDYDGKKCKHLWERSAECWKEFHCHRGDPLPDWHDWPVPNEFYIPREIHFDKSGLSGRLRLQPGSVRVMHIRGNNITGTVPILTLRQRELTQFKAGDNFLHGTIPLIDAPNLQYIQLSNNQLIGAIPLLDRVPHLRELYIDNNRLTGTIPPLNRVPYLKHIDFSYNRLRGWIPASMGTLPLQSLLLQHNQLTGTLPARFGHQLHTLIINHNKLLGPLPELGAMVYADLGDSWQCFLPVRRHTMNGGWRNGNRCAYSVWPGVKILGEHLRKIYVGDIHSCQASCVRHDGCTAWTWNEQWHWCLLYADAYTAPLQPHRTSTTGLPAPKDQCAFTHGVECVGGDIEKLTNVADQHECCQQCHNTEGCSWWTFSESSRTCFLKTGCSTTKVNADGISGVVLSQ